MEERSGIIYHLESNSCAAQTVQFSFAITTKRNEGAALSGLIMISRIMVVWKGKERRMTLENRHDLLCPLTHSTKVEGVRLISH